MRICIDATSLLLRSAGVKNYVYHWMRSLQTEAPELDISAFPALGRVGALDHERSVLNLWQTLPRIALLHGANYGPRALIEAAVGRVDVFHASNQMEKIPHGPKLTGTIFDMTAMLMPQFHTAGNIKAEARFYERVLKRADGLIAISHSAKNDAVRLLGLDPEKIAVIYPGIDPRFFSAEPAKAEKPYVLYVGTIEPRKNIDGILDAWQALPKSTREEYELILAGPLGWAARATVDRIRAGMIGVRYIGYVPESDLPGLTAGASVFVYPSHFEGFGFPLAQAMAAGVPAITSNVASMPEVAGDAGVLVDPLDTAELRDAMQRLLTSPTERAQRSSKGREQARQFTWKNSALQSAEFFHRVMGS
jgi:alpha-1,3-rhamnosyl/mannosyltransferase